MMLTYIIALPSTVQFTKHRHYFESHHPYVKWFGLLSISISYISKENTNDLSKVIQFISRRAEPSGPQFREWSTMLCSMPFS